MQCIFPNIENFYINEINTKKVRKQKKRLKQSKKNELQRKKEKLSPPINRFIVTNPDIIKVNIKSFIISGKANESF